MAEYAVADNRSFKFEWINKLERMAKIHILEFENNDLTNSNIWNDIVDILYNEFAEKYDAAVNSLSSIQLESLAALQQLIANNVTEFAVEDNSKLPDEVQGTYSRKADKMWIRPGLPAAVSCEIVAHEFTHKLMYDVCDEYLGLLDPITNEAMAFFAGYQIVGKVLNMDLLDIAIEASATAMLWGMYLGYGRTPEYRYTTREEAFASIDKYCVRLEQYYQYLSEMFEELGL